MPYPSRVDESTSIETDILVLGGGIAEACMIDVMLPGEPGKHPVAAYPDECWHCGCCVMEYPTGAVSLHHPLVNQTRRAAKDSLLKKRRHSNGKF